MKKYIGFVLSFLILLSLLTYSYAAPSIFINDSPWYRDSSEPLIEQNGVIYVPSSAITAFNYISVTYHGDNNILIFNRDTGAYISALITEKKAAVNGEIKSINVLKYNGIAYFDYKILCEVLSLNSECKTVEENKTILRLYDENARLGFDYLLELQDDSGKPEETDDVINNENNVDKAKIIYLVTDYDIGEYNSVCEYLDSLNLRFTVMISEYDNDDAVLYASSHGEFGICGSYSSVNDLDSINERICSLIHLKIHVIRKNYSLSEMNSYYDAGYISIEPNFTVTSVTNPYYLVSDVQDYLLNYGDYCIISLDNSTVSMETINLLNTLDPLIYNIKNIED